MRYSLRFKFAEAMRKHGYTFNEENQPEVRKMLEDIAALENHSINFNITFHDDGAWVAVATNVDGILTGSRNRSELDALIKDATFTYYGVPPKYCKDSILKHVGEPVTAQQSVHVTA